MIFITSSHLSKLKNNIQIPKQPEYFLIVTKNDKTSRHFSKKIPILQHYRGLLQDLDYIYRHFCGKIASKPMILAYREEKIHAKENI